jgi:hypothetical protein
MLRLTGYTLNEMMPHDGIGGGGGASGHDIINTKHKEYYTAARRYRAMYYITRLGAGLSAGLLPFVVTAYPVGASALAVAVVIFTVVDAVFRPQDKWRTLSQATDMLYVARLKVEGKYKELKDFVDIILTTEERHTLDLVGLEQLVKKAQSASK